MSKFKVGDRVRCIDNDGSGLYKVGTIYIIEDIRDAHPTANVEEKYLIKCKGVPNAMYNKRFELVKEEPVFKTKLINGRPTGELNMDPPRRILIEWNTGECEIRSSKNNFSYAPQPNCSYVVAWAEVIKPEPKPDANGWWNMSEVTPEHNQLVELYHYSASTTLVRYWREHLKTNSITKWREFKGPVE